MTFRWRIVTVAAALLPLPAVPAEAQWPQCAANLDALRAAAEEVHEATGTVASLEASLLETRDSYTRCRQDLDVFRIDRDTSPIRAAVQRDECNQQVQAYRTTERRHNSEMDRASSLFRTRRRRPGVELSCHKRSRYAPGAAAGRGAEPGLRALPRQPAGRAARVSACALYGGDVRRRVRGLPRTAAGLGVSGR